MFDWVVIAVVVRSCSFDAGCDECAAAALVVVVGGLGDLWGGERVCLEYGFFVDIFGEVCLLIEKINFPLLEKLKTT